MAGFKIRRHGFATAGALVASVIDDMVANGFRYVGVAPYTKPVGAALDKFSFTFEATEAVDPLNATALAADKKQPWRINFSVYDNATAGIVVGAAQALPDDNSLSYALRKGSDGLNYYDSPIGVVGAKYTKIASTIEMPAESFALCEQWDEGKQIASTALSPDHPDYGKQVPSGYGTTAAKYTFNSATMAAKETYQTYCIKKPIAFTHTNVTDFSTIAPEFQFPEQGFINRSHRVWQGVNADFDRSKIGAKPAKPAQPTDPTKDLSASYPMSYYLAITPRGMFLSVWEGGPSDVNGMYYSWVLVQRPVDRDTGAVITTGKAPLFCVNSVGNKINRFVVREADVIRALDPVDACIDTADNAAIINDKVQVAVSEDNQYVVSFPSRLNTPRYAYTYELDMIGYTAATVVQQNTEIPLTLYNEPTPRKYISMHSNIENGNGMRIVALLEGGGITA